MAEDKNPPVLIPLLVLALIPIFTAVGAIVANELLTWQKRGFKIW